MEYKYCSKDNFEDFACGRVIYHKTGMPNFPVRLSQEIYNRCLSYLKNKSNITVYDPCCGGGYLLTVLGFLNMSTITEILGSDIEVNAINLAKSNLSLLTKEGLESRVKQLKLLYETHRKSSHLEAIDSSNRMMDILKNSSTLPKTTLFQANILDSTKLVIHSFKTDIVITDVPYGNLVNWQGEEEDNINKMLENLIPILKENAVVAICSDKKQKIKSERFKRLEKQIIGKRKFEILTMKIS